MADEVEEQEDERASELSAISAIYPETVIDPSDPYTASIDIRVDPIKPLAVVFAPLADTGAASDLLTPPTSEESGEANKARRDLHTAHLTPDGLAQDVHHLSHLPPLALKIHLPDGYPTQKPPAFDLRTALPWLPKKQLAELRAAGLTIWEDMGRDQVVFSYIDFLHEAAERGFDITPQGEDFLRVSHNLKIALLDFDLQAKRTEFGRRTFECGVCLEPKKGAACHRLLLCSHVFCVECLQDFFNTCIAEGDVTNVKCMAPNCDNDSTPNLEIGMEIGNQQRKRRRKVDRTLDPSELLQIPLDQETVHRYITLKRKKKLESKPNTVYCPRQWCQGPARSKKAGHSSQESDSETEDEIAEPRQYDRNANEENFPPRSERLAICEDCTFAFCKVCKASWHGEYFSCFPRKLQELTAEEQASEEYMTSFTSRCPTCRSRCQKTMGCNHMICFRCNAHFCYLCTSGLDVQNPYKHFNNKQSPCYMRLWELEGGDGIGAPNQVRHVLNPDDVTDSEDEDDEDPEPPLPPPPPAPPRALPFRPNHGRAAPVAHPPAVAPPRGRAARVQAGLQRPAPVPRNNQRPPVQGLRRFLELAQGDEEDEWDSDEMEDDEFDDGI